MNCTKCGTQIKDNTSFCGHCGETTSAQACSKCGGVLPEGMFFCPSCGAKVGTVATEKVDAPSAQNNRTLIISRDSQFVCAGCTYKIIVNGNDFGNIAPGIVRTVYIATPISDVEIICTTFMMTRHKVRLKLRLGNSPHVRFKLEYGGRIIPFVSGAEIL